MACAVTREFITQHAAQTTKADSCCFIGTQTIKHDLKEKGL
jgi:hypothetical protein